MWGIQSAWPSSNNWGVIEKDQQYKKYKNWVKTSLVGALQARQSMKKPPILLSKGRGGRLKSVGVTVSVGFTSERNKALGIQEWGLPSSCRSPCCACGRWGWRRGRLNGIYRVTFFEGNGGELIDGFSLGLQTVYGFSCIRWQFERGKKLFQTAEVRKKSVPVLGDGNGRLICQMGTD